MGIQSRKRKFKIKDVLIPGTGIFKGIPTDEIRCDGCDRSEFIIPPDKDKDFFYLQCTHCFHIELFRIYHD